MELTLELEDRTSAIAVEESWTAPTWGLAPDSEEILKTSTATSMGDPFPFLRAWYLALHQRYFEEAEKFLEEGNLNQASEKYWGACAELVKAIAAEEGVELKHHFLIGRYVDEKLAVKDPESRTSFDAANALHINFYENNLGEDGVKERAKKIKEFIRRLRSLSRF